MLAVRRHEPGETSAAGTFLDVGAHIGTCSIAALLAHGFERAVAIEPSPENYTLLRANAVLNAVDERIEALELAVSDGTGRAQLELRRFDSGAHRLVNGEEGAGKDRRVDVERMTLDQLVERGVFSIGEVGLASVDVRGHALEVLHGGSSLLRAGVPLLLRIDGESENPEALAEILGSHYALFLDLHSSEQQPQPRGISELASMLGEPGGDGKGAAAGLLLLSRALRPG